MSILKDFKEFAMKGNVMDLAVAVIIGGAFGKIVTSLVQDILMPLIGLATSGASFADKFYAFDGKTYASLDEARKAGGGVFAYGSFIQSVIDFLIIAFCIFLIVKALNNLRKKEADEPAAPPAPTNTEKLLVEIRDALRNGRTV
jgi:large conductance mechanosensitive channel